ncbi:hypothetical protein BKA66DRAFT_439313 [Pyrenochaeta sp. MPI-SDFR-AT-0127]|nr:hypothetical protein BKA66DRAFT_439313 [Pyrenochaeta sp. MPI-SDFR-AT-0127]
MQLYTFGFNVQTQTNESQKERLISAPEAGVEAIKVLWSSWCDAIVARQDAAGSWTIDYLGAGLTTTQKDHIAQSEELRNAVSRGGTVSFFGSTMHAGLQGYTISNSTDPEVANKLVVFATDLDISNNVPEVQPHNLSTEGILDAKIISGGDILLSMINRVTGGAKVLHFRDFTELWSRLRSNLCLYSKQGALASFVPAQWVTNATTSTVLDQHGKVYTSTRDSRYSKSLGRPYEGSSAFELVPYLSETCVTKIASGGFMSAAVSSDGELFLWGEACPGTDGKLSVFNIDTVDEEGLPNFDSMDKVAKVTGIWAEGEQDEFVKCLTIRIDGEEARAYDVAIGCGHILVAVESLDSSGKKKRALFAAGENNLEQLGPNGRNQFFEDFEEVIAFRDKQIAQLVAAGWSTFVVTPN